MQIHSLKKPIYVLLICSTFSGYAIAWKNEQGIVVAEQKIITKNSVTHRIRNGALIGGIGIGLTAGIIEIAAGALSAGAGIFIPLAAMGYGGIGASLGSAIGAATYLFKPNHRLTYVYKVKSLSNSTTYTVQQASLPIPVNTRVRIIERGKTRLIRKV